jgi:lysyl-tRNA synthetase class 2
MHLKDLEQVRYSRLEKIRDLGFDPYGYACIEGGSIPVIDKSSVIENTFNSIGESIGIRSVQGRIILFRDNGKLIWAQVQDELGVIQVAISKKDVRDEKIFQLAKLLDLGDIICASGPVRKTQSGQITIWANDVVCQCKSLAHPPDKVDGLKDVETRYRKRYLDMAYNTSVLKNLKIRSKIISQLRKFFTNREFIEVETPMLHAIAGGAAARPFKTHLNALNIPLYLRVAPELYLKRLIVGGMSSIFEINRNFRNEGIDATHNPEFTALEAYAINHDVRSFMGLLHKALTHLAYEIDTEFKDSRVSGLADTSIRFNNHIINMSIFATKNYADLYLQGTGKNLLEQPDFHKANKEFEELCEPLIDPSVPTFL